MTRTLTSGLVPLSLGLAALGLTAAHPASATVTLQNGNFNAASNDGSTTAISYFTPTSSYGYVDGTHYIYHGTANNQAGYINGGSIFQPLGTTNAVGQTLTLNGVYINNNVSGSMDPAATTIEFTSAAPTSADPYAANSILASETLTAATAGGYYSFTPLTYTATAAIQSVYLVLGGPDTTVYGNYGAQTNYGDLTLTTGTASPAPEVSEAGTLTLIGLGLGGLLLRARRRAAPTAA